MRYFLIVISLNLAFAVSASDHFDFLQVGFETGHARFSPNSEVDGTEIGHASYERFYSQNHDLSFAIPKRWTLVEVPNLTIFGEVTRALRLPKRGAIETISKQSITNDDELVQWLSDSVETPLTVDTQNMKAFFTESKTELCLWTFIQPGKVLKLSYLKENNPHVFHDFQEMLRTLRH
ncbi:hypothetical protein GW915_04700 [bacterium]|nr:hypothetical protein [bacterium]